MTAAHLEQVDCVVIGAGVVGLAAGRAMALRGREVLVLEAAGLIGSGVSSRNSEVIHAGMYYPAGSLKARLCVQGNRMLRDYAADHGVPFSMCGKLIVATDDAEQAKLAEIAEKGRVNGVTGLRSISAAEAMELEPQLRCTAALFSADTGIIDTHALMLSLQGEIEERGGAVVLNSPVIGGRPHEDGIELQVGGADPMGVSARSVIIAAGLQTCPIARMLGVPGAPRDYLCKGSYFTLTGKTPFKHLVYPLPAAAGLGVHFTLDMAGRGRFGPDVEWVEAEDYKVDPARGDQFYGAVRRYWPGLADGALEPGYCGIRPKINAPDEAAADFAPHFPAQHGIPGLAALYGIESPGLTSCLALAEMVAETLA